MYTDTLYIHTHHLNQKVSWSFRFGAKILTTRRRLHHGSIDYPSADSLAVAMGSGCPGNRKQHIDTCRFIYSYREMQGDNMIHHFWDIEPLHMVYGSKPH